MIALDPPKGSRSHFVARVDVILSHSEIKVSYMRRSKMSLNTFIFPRVADVTSVSKEQVVGILPKPVEERIKRRAGYFQFKVTFAGLNMR